MSVAMLASFIAVISDNILHDLVVDESVELPVEVEVEVEVEVDVEVEVAVMLLCPVTGGVT